MSKHFYPDLSGVAAVDLAVVRDLALRHPDYLDQSGYSEEMKEFFKSTMNSPGSTPINGGGGEGTDLDLGEELKALYRQISRYDISALEPNESIAWSRTMTQVLQKLVEVEERIYNSAKVKEYNDVVMQVAEEVLTKDQIADFIERLKSA